MSVPYAFVTLLTSDAYLPGALTVAAALKDVHASDQTAPYETVCLVTPETVDVTTIRLLRKAFDVVVGVETIVPPETESLTFLGRPDLDAALTKLHVFRLTQYSKVIFLDADVLPLRPLSHLFHIDHEFSAVPDVGWPDVFNSGVMVLSPGEDKFNELRDLLHTKGTWDGADQGLLNEWRGASWNRLSFTYNTTPTATYTYAPAYKHFGSRIAVLHFIGPHKPWHSIAYRTPGSFTQSADMTLESSSESPTAQHSAYDYGSLVDRWYDVYDQHYRSQPAEPGFQPSKYTSVWNEKGLRHAMLAGRVLGLEELRRVALEGMETSGIVAPRVSSDGEYRTMPLEGRFDLVRPRTRAEKKEIQIQKEGMETPMSTSIPVEPPTIIPEPTTPPAQILSLPSSSPVRWTTLPTPEVHEIPPAPHTRLISLPSTPLRFVSAEYKRLRNTREVGAQTVPVQRQKLESGRYLSRTHLVSSPAAETPQAASSAPAPTDNYFPKVWETNRDSSSILPPSSEAFPTTTEPGPSMPQSTSATFLSSSLMPVTPEMARSQGDYHNTVRVDGSSTPDPTKVKRIFPWEERPRHVPGRVFPDELSPALSTKFPVSPTPQKKIASRSPMPSPLAGLPSLHSHYSSGDLFSQTRAEKDTKPVPPSGPLGLEDELDRAESRSQDGDVEDEVDSQEEAGKRPRMRSPSIEMMMRSAKYYSIGVQTDPRDLREEAVQVSASAPVDEAVEKSVSTNGRLRRLTSPGAAGFSTHAATHPSPLSQPKLGFNQSRVPSNLRDRGSPTTSTSVEVGDRPPSASPRRFSAPAEPPSPSDGSVLPHIRKGSRVWDPARGVETFKQGSEEVLAKFMKIGSWEERA